MDKLAKYIIVAGAAAIVLFLGWYFRTILLYIAIAVVISLIGKPVVKFLTNLRIKNFHIPRWLASFLTLALILCVCLSLFLLLAPMIGEFVHLLNNMSLSSLSTHVYEPLEKLNEFIIKSIPSIDPNFRIEVYLFDYIRNFININTFSNIIVSLASFLTDFGIAVFSIVFIAFFLLMENGLITNVLTTLVPDRLEVHRKYVDVQAVIRGEETLYACSGAGLAVHSAYSGKNDCGFLVPSDDKPLVKLPMKPGNFAVFFPQDAHMGKGAEHAGAQNILKVVVKIAVEQL